MDKPNTLTAIANLALTLLGEATISSIDSTDARAVVARRVFPQVLREVQSSYRWPELIVEWAPTAAEETNSADDLYRFELPAACLRILDIMTDRAYRVEGGYLITAEEEPTVRYLAYSETPGDWSTQLVQCVVHKLAIEIAPTLTEGLKRRDALQQEYELRILPQARHVSSIGSEARSYRPRRHQWARAHQR
ncbi:MAG TPA: hypothetical protein VI911_00385 [Patescibacteria group bacterium]|nr:hypothetical protein [Patescibacteria group bacterium]